jgi:hypothetical protein
MGLIQDLENWWSERHGRACDRADAKRRKTLLQAERELAEWEAKLAEIQRQDAVCKTFKFSTPLIETRGTVARLKKLIEQHGK